MTTPSAADRTRGVAALFDTVADTYDAVGVPWFRPIGERLVSEVAPEPGQSALDLGCGRGAVLLPLAAAVGPEGSVLGIDVSAGRGAVHGGGLWDVRTVSLELRSDLSDVQTWERWSCSRGQRAM